MLKLANMVIWSLQEYACQAAQHWEPEKERNQFSHHQLCVDLVKSFLFFQMTNMHSSVYVQRPCFYSSRVLCYCWCCWMLNDFFIQYVKGCITKAGLASSDTYIIFNLNRINLRLNVILLTFSKSTITSRYIIIRCTVCYSILTNMSSVQLKTQLCPFNLMTWIKS